MLVGLSGSGKSTYAYKLYRMNKNNTIIISSDEIRETIWGIRTIQDRPDLVFEICHKAIIANLQKGRDVIFDATNLRSKDRHNFLADVRKVVDAWCECHILVVPIEKCIENDKHRIVVNMVGEEVVQKQAHKFQIPFKEEGWDEIKLIPQDGHHFNEVTFWKYSLSTFFRAANGFDQHTPYHNLTLWEHAEKHEQFVSNYISNADLDSLPNAIGRAHTASILHDYGKIFTHTEDENGIWHYYGHAEYGAYKLLTDTLHPDIILAEYKSFDITHQNYLNAIIPALTEGYLDAMQEILDVVFFVNYHMLPFDWNTDKIKNKYKKIFGEDKFNCLMIMHEADCNGKDFKEGETND